MAAPAIHGRYRTVPASTLLETLGESLKAIKRRDNLTDIDIGAVLGKGDDAAANYRVGSAEMGVLAFVRGCKEWDGHFANEFLALAANMKLVPLDASDVSDREGTTAITCALLALLKALEDDEVVDDEELRAAWPSIEAAGRVFDQYRERARQLALPRVLA